MLKTSIDTQQGACTLFVLVMFFPLQKLGIVCCTSSVEVPSQQYGWLRFSKSRREFFDYLSTPLTMSFQTSIRRSQGLCSACRTKARGRGHQPGLTSATECDAASGPLFNTGTKRHAHCARVERPREPPEPR